jgi:starch-binding outer membrane protein, SusD/RagB family
MENRTPIATTGRNHVHQGSMKNHLHERRGGAPRRRTAWVAVLGLVGLLGACDTLDRALEVEAPSRIPAANLNDPTSATLLLNGAIADFECAFNAYTVMSGLVGEELMDATQTADRWPYDRREVQPSDGRYATFGCEALGVYTPLSTARWAAENALNRLEGWTDAQMPAGMNRTSMIATAATYSGYAHVLLGEGFCSGVVLGPDLAPGGEASRADLFRRAEERFARAIEAAQAANNTEMLNTARVGRARARLNLGNPSGAAADARLVPANFVRNVTASTVATRRYNRVFQQNNEGQAVSVAPEFRNLTVDGVPDPRVRVTDTGRNATDGTRIWVQNKYTGLASSLPLATGREARLIVAEAEGGQTAIDIINGFRTQAGLPRFAGGTPAQIRAEVIEERRRELFLESHHIGDVQRYQLPLRPATGTVFPKGGTYGNTTCLPLPNVERLNNPAFRT